MSYFDVANRQLIFSKIGIAILFLITRLTFGLLPVVLHKKWQRWKESNSNTERDLLTNKKTEKGIILLQSFGSGIFLATCFLHMAKHLRFSVETWQMNFKLQGVARNYPWVQLALSMGFFLVYFLEEFAHWLIDKKSCEICNEKVSRLKKFRRTRKSTKGRKLNRPEGDIEKGSTSQQAREQEKRVCSVIFEEIEMNIFGPNDFGNADSIRITSNSVKSHKCCYDKLIKEICKEEMEKTKNRQQIMHWVLAVTAVSIQALLEGISLGMKRNVFEIWILSISVAFHSMSFLFYLGLKLVLSNAKEKFIYIQLGIISAINPIGIILGIVFSCRPNVFLYAARVVLEGFSTGTVLYVLFFEVLEKEKNKRIMGINRTISLLSGFFCTAVLEYGDTYYKD